MNVPAVGTVVDLGIQPHISPNYTQKTLISFVYNIVSTFHTFLSTRIPNVFVWTPIDSCYHC